MKEGLSSNDHFHSITSLLFASFAFDAAIVANFPFALFRFNPFQFDHDSGANWELGCHFHFNPPTFPQSTLKMQSNGSQSIDNCAVLNCLMLRICGCRCVSISFEATPRDQFWRGTNAPPFRPWNYPFRQSDTLLCTIILVFMTHLTAVCYGNWKWQNWPVMSVFRDGPLTQAFSDFGHLLNTGVMPM